MAASVNAGKVYTELMLNGGAKFAKGLNRARAQLNGFATGAMQSGRRMAMIGIAAALPFTAGVKVFADYQQQMANVSTMVDNVAAHMPRLSKGVEELSVKSGESTETLTRGLYDILSASIPAEKALKVLAVSARAARAGLTDTGVAADAITTLLNSYGLSADKAGSVSDLLFSIVKRGKTTFAELAPSIGMVASTASSAEVSMEEMGAALSVMTRNGVRTRNAVTALNAIISTFLNPTAAAAKFARKMVFEMSSAAIKSQGLEGIFRKISKLPTDAIAKLFPNVRALRGVLPALKNMQGFSKDIVIMTNRAGRTDAAYKKMANTMAMVFSRIKQAGVAVFRELGQVMEKPVLAGAKAIFKYLKAAKKWITANKKLVVTVAGGIGLFISMGFALMAVAVIAKVLAFTLGGLSLVLMVVKGLFIGISAIIAFFASPVGLAIAAVAALGGAILYYSGLGGKALDWLMGKFSELKDFAGKTWSAISDALLAGDFALAAKVALTALNMVWQWAINEIMGYWINFKAWYMSIVTKIAHGGLMVINDLRAGWEKGVNFMSLAITGLFTSVQSTFNKIHGWLAKQMMEIEGLFDKDFDVKAAKKLIDIEVNQRESGHEALRQQGIADFEQRKTDIDGKHKEREEQIVTLSDTELNAQRNKYEKEMTASRAKLAKAKSEWQSAVGEAESKKKKTARKSKASSFDAPGVRTAINTAMKKTDVAGSFYANIRALSSGPAADRTAKATEKIAANTARTNKLLKKNKLVYG